MDAPPREPLSEGIIIDRIATIFNQAGLHTDFNDDCAHLDEKTDLISADTLVENLHFDRRWDTPYKIGRQAAICNLSDIAGSGGIPSWVTWALSVPDSWTLGDLEALTEGFASICAPAATPLIGGNLTRTFGPMVINVTVGGHLAGRRPLTRTGAQAGDRVCVSGVLGNAALGYIQPDETTRALRHQWRPHLEEAVFLARSSHVTAMMDISDGLLLDASRLAGCSGVRIDIDTSSVPVSADYLAIRGDDRTLAMRGGEDYVLLFTCDTDQEIPSWAYSIGRCKNGQGLSVDGRSVDPKGHDHFAGVRQN